MNALETYRQGFLKDMEVQNYSPTSILKYGHCVRLLLEWMEQKGLGDLRKIGKGELTGMR